MKQYYVKSLSIDNNCTCIYLPRDLKSIGYLASKHVKLTVNDDETLTISKIVDGRDNQI